LLSDEQLNVAFGSVTIVCASIGMLLQISSFHEEVNDSQSGLSVSQPAMLTAFD